VATDTRTAVAAVCNVMKRILEFGKTGIAITGKRVRVVSTIEYFLSD